MRIVHVFMHLANNDYRSERVECKRPPDSARNPHPKAGCEGPEGILRLDYGKNVPMPRELLWLENTLCGLGSACAWIIAPSLHETSGRPSVEVKEAFNKHECEKFPRILRKAPGGR